VNAHPTNVIDQDFMRVEPVLNNHPNRIQQNRTTIEL
jgi:hypothetical protein